MRVNNKYLSSDIYKPAVKERERENHVARKKDLNMYSQRSKISFPGGRKDEFNSKPTR